MSLKLIKAELRKHINKEKAAFFPRFFKTGKGEYGEGDKFIGVTIPYVRAVAKEHWTLPLVQLEKLLYSKIHEERLLALLILVQKYTKGDDKEKTRIYKYYVKHMKQANNWDLVDLSAYKIVGHYLEDKDKSVLYKWAKSKNLWVRRVSMVCTFQFIRNHDLGPTYKLADLLIKDEEDLMHKAVGWMLREAGKRDFQRLERYVLKNVQRMPRTMLRYAIEKFPEIKRKKILKM